VIITLKTEKVFSNVLDSIDGRLAFVSKNKNPFYVTKMLHSLFFLPMKHTGIDSYDPQFFDRDRFISLIRNAELTGVVLELAQSSPISQEALIDIFRLFAAHIPQTDLLKLIKNPINKAKVAFASTPYFQRTNCIFKPKSLKHPSFLHYYLTVSSGCQNAESRRILDLKQDRSSAIEYYSDKLNAKLTLDDFVICVVPPSSASRNPSSGIHKVAKNLAKKGLRLDGTSVLVRTKSIQKKSYGGCRDLSVDLESIEVKDPDIIRGRKVLLLDDVTTTGNSLKANKTLLLQHKPLEVVTFALAQTASKY